MKQVMTSILAILVSVYFGGIVSANDIQTDKLTDKKKVTSPATKSINPLPGAKKGQALGGGASTGGQKNGEGGTATTKQSKQEHDRAMQVIDNLK